MLFAPHTVVALPASVQVDAFLRDCEVLSRTLHWLSPSSTVPRNIEAAAIPAIVALVGSRFVDESRRVRWGLFVHRTIIWTILAEKWADKGVTLVTTDQLLSIEARLERAILANNHASSLDGEQVCLVDLALSHRAHALVFRVAPRVVLSRRQSDKHRVAIKSASSGPVTDQSACVARAALLYRANRLVSLNHYCIVAPLELYYLTVLR